LRTCGAWAAYLGLSKHSITWCLVCFLLGGGQAPRGAWASPPQASSTTPPDAWSACSWVLGLPILLV